MKMHLRDMIAAPGVSAGLPDGRWVRAVPEPFFGGLFDRARDAWSVLRGETFAIYWPKASELEDALGIPPSSCVRPALSERALVGMVE